MNITLTALVISSCFIAVIKCGANFTTDGHTYYSSYPLQSNWFQARRSCLLLGMELIDVPTYAENARIKKTIYKIKSRYLTGEGVTAWWTSGTNVGTNFFYWDTTGAEFVFMDWERNQPDNHNDNEHCVHYSPWHIQWNDANCDVKLHFICRVSKK